MNKNDISQKCVTMAHGSGGTMMRDIIEQMFFKAYAGKNLQSGDDAATLEADSSRIAFSTDTFVVTPHFFPGADIGHLAVCGTVNDVATSGAIPKWISVAFVLEEGYPLEKLDRICASIAKTAAEAQVEVVTGDTKVVNHGAADGIYINTAGIGVMREGIELSGNKIKPGDKVLISGTLGDHGITIISTREELAFSTTIKSDAAPLNHLISDVLNVCPAGSIHAFRDPTRGGLASTLNEFAQMSSCDIYVDEHHVPIKPEVNGACEMLGFDVFQVANEGKMVCICAPEVADDALQAMRNNKYGKDAAIIGEVCESSTGAPRVYLRTVFGSERILDMLVGEQLPRIC